MNAQIQVGPWAIWQGDSFSIGTGMDKFLVTHNGRDQAWFDVLTEAADYIARRMTSYDVSAFIVAQVRGE